MISATANPSEASSLVQASAAASTRAAGKTTSTSATDATATAGTQAASASKTDASQAKTPTGQPLSDTQQKQVDELKKIDKDTRAHEQAHLAAAGGLAVSGANYKLTTGPDGKQYANGGDVSVDVSPGRTPEETVRKARIIQAAALAPAGPSGQDFSVAAQARAMEMQAQAEIAKRTPQGQQLAGAYQPSDQPQQSAFSAVA